MRRLVIVAVLLISIISCFAQTLQDQEKELIYDLLERNDLERNSLDFLKDWAGDTEFKLPQIVEILNHPLEFPAFTDKLAAKIETGIPEELMDFVMEVLASEGETNYFKLYENSFIKYEKKFFYEVEGEKDIMKYVEDVWTDCEIERTKAFEGSCGKNKWEQEEAVWKHLTTSMWSEPEDSLEYKKYYEKYDIAESESIESDTLKAMIGRLSLEHLFRAAVINRAGFTVLDNYLKYMNIDRYRGVTYNSRFGKMLVGSSTSDMIYDDYVFIYEPGGDDTYHTRIAADWKERPYFWVIDDEGNDNYIQEELAGLCGVQGGIGIFKDRSGDDVYRGRDYSVSAVWGYCEFIDEQGNDIYDFGLHSAGAATFGISLLKDLKGNDSYRVTQYGEGFGSCLGFGALIDMAGFDNYYAGGKYMHAPLAPLDYRSLSQGFGFGMRPDLAGGIGMIYDHTGNDNYTGGVYSQAVAYWYALGIIYDREGYDYYDSVYYPQGSGIHLAGGFLFDGAGEDHYYSKHGPGQGAAHDWAVGFLIDRSGNDHYSVEGGNGTALTNSVTVFLDVCGDDNYQRQVDSNYGYNRGARGTGGVGIFLDTGGKDKYPLEFCGNDTMWARGYYGIGFDTLMVEAPKELKEMDEEKAAEIDSLASIEEIWKLASGWGVGSNQQTVKRAGEILVNRGDESAKWLAENTLDTKSGLAFRALSNFTDSYDGFKPFLLDKLTDEDSLVAKNSISLISNYADSTLIDKLLPFLEEDKYTNSVIGSMGSYDCRQSVEILKAYRNDDSEKTRFITARGLLALKRDDAREALMEMADDESFLIRTLVKMQKDKEDKK